MERGFYLYILGVAVLICASWRRERLSRPGWLKPIGLALLVIGAAALATGLYTHATPDEAARYWLEKNGSSLLSYYPPGNVINGGTVIFWDELGVIDMNKNFASGGFSLEAQRGGLASILLGAVLVLSGGIAVGKTPWKLALIVMIVWAFCAWILWCFYGLR